MPTHRNLNETFAALADPTRRAILARLASGPASVGELAEPFDMSLPAVSRHIRVLTRAGLVRQHRQAQFRRCELVAAALEDAGAWIDRYRGFWEQSFDSLDTHLVSRGQGKATTRKARPSTTDEDAGSKKARGGRSR